MNQQFIELLEPVDDPASFDLSSLQFDKNPYQRISILMNPLNIEIHQVALLINDDTGANYDLNTVSMTGSGYSGPPPLLNQNQLFLGPGGTGGGTNEKFNTEIGLLYTGTETHIFSKTYTNGSAAGDIHFFVGKYKSADIPVKLSFPINLNTFPNGVNARYAFGSTLKRHFYKFVR